MSSTNNDSFVVQADVQERTEVYNVLNDGNDIGLLRMETLLNNHWLETYNFYCEVVQLSGGKPVTIALGCDSTVNRDNGIRYFMSHPDIFCNQLKGILLASKYGNVRIALSGVTDLREFKWAKEQFDTVKKQLACAETPCNYHIPMGLLVDIPAVVITLDMLMHEVNFFIVDSERLQYHLMVLGGKLECSSLCDPLHPAILRSLRQIMNSKPGNRPEVLVCGKLAELPEAIPILIGLGVKGIAVKNSLIPELSRLSVNLDFNNAARIASKALALSNPRRVKDYVQAALERL